MQMVQTYANGCSQCFLSVTKSCLQNEVHARWKSFCNFSAIRFSANLSQSADQIYIYIYIIYIIYIYIKYMYIFTYSICMRIRVGRQWGFFIIIIIIIIIIIFIIILLHTKSIYTVPYTLKQNLVKFEYTQVIN